MKKKKFVKKNITVEDSRSLDRPAWTQEDQHAYRHKHVGVATIGNDRRPAIIHNYYVKSEGKE